MRILVTGARGKVGGATVDALLAAGHDVTATDVGAPVFERRDPAAAAYVQAALTDAGAAFAVVRGHDAVIHAAAIPEPTQNPPHVVFHNNVMSTFNAVEAAVRWEVGRFVNVSSETAPGWFFAERAWLPDYLPVDEEHPLRPQDPYAMSKVVGEQLMDAAVRRSDVRCISVRPSWVQWEGNIERNLGPIVSGADDGPSAGFWSYVDLYDSPRCCASRLSPSCRATRSSTPPSPTTRPARRSPTSCAATTATRSSCVNSTAPTPRASPRPRPSGCWAGSRRARGATTSTTPGA
jgi:NAD(P)-dependent dehydrogenase (short-subunit alcohol dehydrogenase family)